ncbi:GNAT family N-acetyltransferase [Kushneria aurantia]|uniref:GNAT family protein n=1 Tax=Kushneria aurantia TaxID=504092 RepID=A0ABV6G5Y8_9GAMM
MGLYPIIPSGKGLMKRAMMLVISEAFERHQLHRLEANIQPGNLASIALVESLGFRLEGYSPRYLNIAGQWRDYHRYAITVEDWQ